MAELWASWVGLVAPLSWAIEMDGPRRGQREGVVPEQEAAGWCRYYYVVQ